MKLAVILLNRNLPKPTETLYEKLDGETEVDKDIFVVEAGSDEKLLSKYTTWHVDDVETKRNGLRFNRGMNYALASLVREKKFEKYSFFLCCTNDAEFLTGNTLQSLLTVMKEHPDMGLLSPCGFDWGERTLLKVPDTKYFWSIYSPVLMFRREMIEDIADFSSLDHMDFFFDGTNFRGFLTENEIIAKGYVNGWCAGVTSRVLFQENKTLLLDKSDQIKTEVNDQNLALYVNEGHVWLKKKYGFKSRWALQHYTKRLYNDFFLRNSHLKPFKI